MKTKAFGITTRAVSVLLALITAFAAALCLSVNAMALDTNSVRQGVVPVVFYVKNAQFKFVNPVTMEIVGSQAAGDELQWSHGSGFFVGKSGENPQYIVTNHHVVDDYIDANEGGQYTTLYTVTDDGYYVFIQGSSCEMRIYYDENDYDVAYIDCYGDQEKVDLAVLKLRNPTDKRRSLKIAPISDDNVSDTVYTVGYPGIADNSLTAASKYGVNDSTVHKGSVARVAMNSKGVESIATDALINSGNSGGPLVTDSGFVVGVNTWSVSRGDAREDYSISSNTLMDFLDKNNIPYEKAGKDFNPVPIIIIAVVVVVAAAAVVVVMMLKKKGGSAPKAASAQNAASGSSAPAPAQGSSAQGSSGAMLVCEKGILAGRTFPIGNGVVIGRDPKRCGVCFPVETKGVSGAHCEIRKTANGYEILDLGSSYGTTLGSGQKLSPNVAVFIANGTYFMVGGSDQLFQIKY